MDHIFEIGGPLHQVYYRMQIMDSGFLKFDVLYFAGGFSTMSSSSMFIIKTYFQSVDPYHICLDDYHSFSASKLVKSAPLYKSVNVCVFIWALNGKCCSSIIWFRIIIPSWCDPIMFVHILYVNPWCKHATYATHMLLWQICQSLISEMCPNSLVHTMLILFI